MRKCKICKELTGHWHYFPSNSQDRYTCVNCLKKHKWSEHNESELFSIFAMIDEEENNMKKKTLREMNSMADIQDVVTTITTLSNCESVCEGFARLMQQPTLRDQLAMAALNNPFGNIVINHVEQFSAVAEAAYKLADAMLAEREKK